MCSLDPFVVVHSPLVFMIGGVAWPYGISYIWL